MQAISCTLHGIFDNSTAYATLLESYGQANITIRPFNGSDAIILRISEKTDQIMRDRTSKLLDKASSIEDGLSDQLVPQGNVSYHDSDFQRKDLQGFGVSKVSQFPYPVNQSSAVYIPVVKVTGNATFNDISWTSSLVDPASPPQNSYFIGTVNGILRFYPGTIWPEQYDMYDCRFQSWFLQAGSSKHDIAMLIDRSGSVTGITLRTIKRIAKLVLNIIPSSYRFNVFLFNNETVPLKPCLGSDPLPATDDAKSAMLAELDSIQAALPGLFNDALLKLQDTFFNKSMADGICRRMIILFTDGKIDFNVDTIKRTLNDLNVRLLVLDFSSPLSPRTNRQLKEMACAVNGHYVFVKKISDWFEVADMFFDTVCSKYVTPLPVPLPQWSDPTITFYKKKSMILSVPLYNKSSETSILAGVLGTEVLLDDFVTELSNDAGSLTYAVISLPSGRVIRHPRLLASSTMPTLINVGAPAEGETLVPADDLTRSPISSISRVEERVISGLKYHLVIPENDVYDISLGAYDNEIDTADTIINPAIGKTLFVRLSSSHSFKFDRSVTVFKNCDGIPTMTLRDICPSFVPFVLPILRDVIVTSKTVEAWSLAEKNANIRGSYIITRKGLLRSTLPDLQDPSPKRSQEWVEFSANPNKFIAAPNTPNTLLVTQGYGKRVNLAKSITTPVDNSKRAVLAVMVTSLRSGVFPTAMRELHELYDLGKLTSYLLDHKGYVLYSSNSSPPSFFGEVSSVVFKMLLDRGYYIDKVFKDCLSSCPKPEDKTLSVTSGFVSKSIFLRDVLVSLLSFLFTLSQHTLLLAGRSLGFIMPDVEVTSRCCRDVHAYERDYSVSNMFVNDYNLCGASQLSCIETVAAIPVPASNLLLLLIIPTNKSHCKCVQKPITRTTPGPVFSPCLQNSSQGTLNTPTCFKDVSIPSLTHNACDQL